MRFNPPPQWPVPPGWTPPQGWMPDPSWPPAPPGWQFWVEDAGKRRLGAGATIALVAGVVVVVAAIAAALAIPAMTRHHGSASSAASSPASTSKRASGSDSIRVTSTNLVTDPQTGKPKVVLSLYEDFLCPFCRRFEEDFGTTVSQLIDSGQVAADYYMVAILDRGRRDYSSRAGAAAYCVADESIDAFRRFHEALYADQPSEAATSYPDNSELIAKAREAGAADVADCVNNGTYVAQVKGLAAKTDIRGTPTVRINGEDYDPSTPDALVTRIKQITG